MIRTCAASLLALALVAAEPAEPAGPRALSLGEAIALAAASAEVRIAELDAVAARAQRKVATAALLPHVSGTAGYERRTVASFSGDGEVFGPNDAWDARVRVGQALLDIADIHRRRAAGSGIVVADARRALAFESAAAGAAQAYATLLRDRELAAARRDDERLAGELAALAETRVRLGAAEAIDVTRAATVQAAATGARLRSENAAAIAAVALARAIGVDPAAAFVPASPLDERLAASSAPEVESAALALALAARPELRAADAAREQVRLDRLALGGERAPRVEATGDYGWHGPETDDLDPTWSVGIELQVPITDGFAIRSRERIADARLAQAAIRAEDARAQVTADVRAALLDLATARQRRVVAVDGLRLAERELAQARSRYEAGAAGNADVIEAQRSLLLARSSEIEARWAIASAGIALARAVGLANRLGNPAPEAP